MKIITTHEIEASPHAAWRVFGEQFADIADWSSAIVESSIDGPLEEGVVRTCHIKPTGPLAGGVITERLTEFDRARQRLSYDVLTGTPRFIRNLTNHWQFEDIGDGRTRITSEVTVDVAWWMLPMQPLLRGQLAKNIQSFTENFGRYVESSLPG